MESFEIQIVLKFIGFRQAQKSMEKKFKTKLYLSWYQSESKNYYVFSYLTWNVWDKEVETCDRVVEKSIFSPFLLLLIILLNASITKNPNCPLINIYVYRYMLLDLIRVYQCHDLN